MTRCWRTSSCCDDGFSTGTVHAPARNTPLFPGPRRFCKGIITLEFCCRLVAGRPVGVPGSFPGGDPLPGDKRPNHRRGPVFRLPRA